ncbi:sugar ABC transporter substrate-binding protein [Bacillus timonensis]|uniref:Sugar ABC transporter substrate-binding protein n=1 Tax=Bacillus timonensis TaxID=1033734 RepID=A0A4V3V864_9BACI|nr:sugar ABC transporter substrate-binding protein [Bacillus timonensis]THE13943.1 sugar ABC transporter substrate-binding protein [Bacillus timonensis]
MKFNQFGKLVATLGLGLMLAACSSNDADNAKETGKDGKVEITIATWANETEAKEFDAILDKVNAEQDEYTVEQMVIPQDYYTKIQTMIAGNQAPDLLWLAQEYIPAYAKNGAVLDLTDKVDAQDTIDMADYLDGSLDTAKYEGKTYGLPWIGQPYVVYYNKTLFEENGVELPSEDWNWADFTEKAKALTTDEVYGFGTTGNPPLAVWAWGEGGEIVESDGTIKLTSPETLKGLELAASIITDPTVTMPYQEASSLGVEQGFVTGKIAMMVGGANDDVERKVEEAGGSFEVGMAVMPAGSQEHVTFNWTASTLISEQTDNEDIAFKALIDITEKMFDWKVPSPMASKVDIIGEVNPYKAYALDVIKKSTEISRGFNNLPEQNEIGGKQWELLDTPVLTNNNGKDDLNVKQVAEETEKAFEAIIE